MYIFSLKFFIQLRDNFGASIKSWIQENNVFRKQGGRRYFKETSAAKMWVLIFNRLGRFILKGGSRCI